MNFVKKVFENNMDDAVHTQFIRFGKGDYRGRFPLSLWWTKKVKVKTGYEFANDLVLLCSKFGDCNASGIIISKEDLSEIISGIESSVKKKKDIFHYEISNQKLTKEQLEKLANESYFALLDLDGEGFQLRTKKKLPKPGKSEKKIDGGFCKLETEEKFYSEMKKDLFWDVPESKKFNIAHEVIISDIVMPKGEKDFAKIRELAKRKGKIIRKIEIDGKETINEIEFLA